MTMSRSRRAWVTGLAATVITLLVPGVAWAEPPANDDFGAATAITALPFEATVSLAGATTASDDPTFCDPFARQTVWFDYTAPADGIVKATVVNSGFFAVLAGYTGTRGSLTLVPGFCEFGTNSPATFHVTAGTTYHLEAISEFSGNTAGLTLRVESVAPAANDDFAGAEPVTTLPARRTGDLALGALEPGEPVPSCGAATAHSVWYTYTPPTARWVSANVFGFQFSPAVTVYRGRTLADLSEVDCAFGSAGVFRAEVGQTYFIRIGAAEGAGNDFTIDLDNAPAITPSASPSQSEASVFDDVNFFPFSGDRLGRRLVSGEVRFGDGTSAPVTIDTFMLTHRYTADGVYRVEISGATSDGRSGTGSTELRVETHDVTVTGLLVPAKARPDQTKQIMVTVANTRYDETVAVELFKQTAGGFFTHVGTLTQSVPARSGRTVPFPFAYTFSAADAAAGTVTFKAVATISMQFPDDDDNPADNQRTGSTTVRP